MTMNLIRASLISLAITIPAFPVFSADSPAHDNMQGTSGEIQVPTSLSGIITSLQQFGYCMDGGTHLIHTPLGIYRLKGRNADAAKALETAADKKEKVTVMGYPVVGAECSYISVYHV